IFSMISAFTPDSSRTSRIAACSGVSPGPMMPFGICQRFSAAVRIITTCSLPPLSRKPAPPAEPCSIGSSMCCLRGCIKRSIFRCDRLFDGVVELQFDLVAETDDLSDELSIAVEDGRLRYGVLAAENIARQRGFG